MKEYAGSKKGINENSSR